ncbi:MAG: MBL fold metallo-hydrolase [Bacillota bacterium]|nr:MBL fold metallo-hydrolase [Bacillota bacterium]
MSKLGRKKGLIKGLVMLLLVSVSIPLSVGCSTKAGDVKEVNKQEKKEEKIDSIKVQYIGNSCFYLTLSNGMHIVTDPYQKGFDTDFGPFPKVSAELVTVSHTHSDHTGWDRVGGKPKVIQPTELNKPIKVGAVEVTGYPSLHGAGMGDNTIFVFKIGDFKIVHLGEVGKIESQETLKAIKDADLILPPVGEVGAMPVEDIIKLTTEANARVIIPQHYSMSEDNLFYNQPTVDKYLSVLPKGTEINKLDEFVLKKDAKKQVVVLSKMK